MADSMPSPDFTARGTAGFFQGNMESNQSPLRQGVGQHVDQPPYPLREAPMKFEAFGREREADATAVPFAAYADDQMAFNQPADCARQRARIPLQASGQHRERRRASGELAHDEPIIDVQPFRNQRAPQAFVQGLLCPGEIEHDPPQMRSMQGPRPAIRRNARADITNGVHRNTFCTSVTAMPAIPRSATHAK